MDEDEDLKAYQSIPIHQFEVLEDFKEDSRFTPVKIWIAHVGRNLNGSNFSKKVLEKMIPSLAYIPIVGFIEADSANKEDFKGHEERYVVTVDGVEIEYLGRMYGVIPELEKSDARFEKKTVNGVEREYLVANGLIVNKFVKAKDILDRDESKSQSMELVRESLKGSYDKKAEEFVVSEAVFEALCILGDKKKPAMIGGLIEKIQFTSTKFELAEMIEELKQELKQELREELKLKFEEGGRTLNFEKLQELAVNYSLVGEEFIEELKQKLEAYATEEDLKLVLETEQNKQFSLTMNAEASEIAKAVGTIEKVQKYDWEYSRYSYRDHAVEAMEVYAYDYVNYEDVGFTYTRNGDEVSVDMESRFLVVWQPRRKEVGNFEVEGNEFGFNYETKSLIEKYEAEVVVSTEKTKESITSELTAQFEVEKTELQTQIASYTEQIKELDTLTQFKAQVETQAKKDYVASVENLTDTEKQEVLGSIENYSLEQLEEEVVKLVGKKAIKFSVKEEKEIKDSFSKYSHEDKSKPMRAYEPHMKKKTEEK